jgi:hypothetical protein
MSLSNSRYSLPYCSYDKNQFIREKRRVVPL